VPKEVPPMIKLLCTTEPVAGGADCTPSGFVVDVA
jgi:hypothetical protein